MKKIYVKPSIEAVKIQTTTILAGSNFGKDALGGGSGSGNGATVNSFRGEFVEIDE